MSGISEPVDKKLQAQYVQAEQDLFWLAGHGALAGVAEILRERRRQIESCGHSVANDDHLVSGWLMREALGRMTAAWNRVAEGTDGPEAIEEGCRQAGALAAAETDRLIRMLEGRET